jgi:hypothetical protein
MNDKLMKLGALTLSALMLLGCAGREAHPVSTYQYGDEKKSCKALDMELTFTEEKIQRLLPETHKTGKNVGLGVAGVLLIVPWFFMDFTKSEQIEAEALRDRYNQLLVIAEDKNCGLNRQPIPDFKMQPETSQPSDSYIEE